MRVFSSFCLADRIVLTCQAFVVSNVLATTPFDCILMLPNRNSITTMAEKCYNNGRTVTTAKKVSYIRITYSEHPVARSRSEGQHMGKRTSLTQGQTKELFEVFTTADRVTPF